MTYKTVRESAAEIRAALKAKHGWTSRDVSVVSDSYSGGSSIHIKIKSPTVSKLAVEKIANGEEHVRYCEYSGEILSGGNRFVFVDYAEEALAALGAPYVAAVSAAIAATVVGSNSLTPIAGTPFHLGRPETHSLTLWGERHLGQWWSGYDECQLISAAKSIAAKIGTLVLEAGGRLPCEACDCADPTALPGLAAECDCACHRQGGG